MQCQVLTSQFGHGYWRHSVLMEATPSVLGTAVPADVRLTPSENRGFYRPS